MDFPVLVPNDDDQHRAAQEHAPVEECHEVVHDSELTEGAQETRLLLCALPPTLALHQHACALQPEAR